MSISVYRKAREKRSRDEVEREGISRYHQSIKQSFILTRYDSILKTTQYIYTYKKLGNKNIKYKELKPTKKPHTKNATRKTMILVLKTVKSYNRTL